MIRLLKQKNIKQKQNDESQQPVVDFNNDDSLKRRLRLARQFGDSTIAYSTVCQPGLKYFDLENGCDEGEGFQAYGSRWGFDFALGDPVTDTASRGEIIDQFIGQCRRKPCFVNITESTARELADRGYYVNQLGIDTWLELENYDFRGKAKEPFRYAANWLARRDYRIEELSYEQLDASAAEEVSRRWHKTRTVKNREVGFLNRPLVLQDEPDVRKFFLFDQEDRLQAFVYLDPVYENGEITGYSTVIKRRDPDAPGYAEQGIVKHCVDLLKSEGCQTLRLGLSPLAFLTDRTFKKRSPLLQFGWSYGYKAWWVNRYFYNLKGHAAFKRRFRGSEYPVYFATPVMVNDIRVAAMLRLMGAI